MSNVTLAICALGLSACLRFGYTEHSADGGMTTPPDAASGFDASTRDGSAAADATVYGDAAVRLDGAIARDASSLDAATKPNAVDAAAKHDASTTSDASTNKDASTTADSGTPCRPSPVTDYYTSLPALAADPNIDGVLDLRVSQTPCTRNSCRPHANPAAFCTATLQ